MTIRVTQMTKLIQKEEIRDLLKAAAKNWRVYAPQKNSGGDVWFDVFDEAREITLEDVDTVISPKDIFFPQLETCLEFKNDAIRQVRESTPKLLWGVRPCDLKGIVFADNFFKRNFEDIYYLSRIKNRLIVAIGCLKPPRPKYCFCTSAKTGPFADAGYDLQLVDMGDAYLIEVGSETGKEFLKNFAKFFKKYCGDTDKVIAQIKSKAAGSLELKVDFQKALNLMASDDFIPEENYKRIGERCIYCGGCLYVCPTCTCFNVFDNAGKEKGERLRNWDACVFEGYSREASGHNPRGEKWLRTARRYEHKLKFDYAATGMSGCIACGRCLASCPVDIGISKFIQEITEDKKIL